MDEKAVKQSVKQASKPSIMLAAAAVREEAIRSMKAGGRTGKGPGIPSEPGKPPHIQTGNLRNSITVKADETKGSVLIGPTLQAPYGKFHEFGTRKHPPRPFMGPALLSAIRKFPIFFKDLPLGNTKAGRTLNQSLKESKAK